ncbi:MAG: aspartate aminotransferase family protein [Elusimicrobia bacterium]|nr:aspartate aminotransferase family protein [Elusimicrobiota bacterium]
MRIDRSRLKALMSREVREFRRSHPRSAALFASARRSMPGGVPMNWMSKWPGGFPVFVVRAKGARFTDADGREYVDLCLGDTGAMTGHAPAAAVKAIVARLRRGATAMLPTEDALKVAEELQRRVGLPAWQFALTATDANRFSIRLARLITRRPKILVFNYCYHGTVDEAFIALQDGKAVRRRGSIGPPVDPCVTTKVVEFNDVAALEAALAPRDVACVLAEPAMTNVGIVHPAPGFHRALRDLTRRAGTLLILDETHTICAGPGGCSREWELAPDFWVLGKPIGSGIPAAAYGFTAEVAGRVAEGIRIEDCDVGGIGGTLAGNALSMAAMRVTLEKVLTPAAFKRMIPLAERFADGAARAISEAGAPWHVARLGCRAEYLFHAQVPSNGGEAAAAADFDLERFMHLYALNRGVLLTPFHNMALMSPATTAGDVDRHTSVFRQALAELLSASAPRASRGNHAIIAGR